MVFQSVYTRLFIVMLLVAFMLQPLAPVYANEITDSEESVEAEASPEPDAEDEPVSTEAEPETNDAPLKPSEDETAEALESESVRSSSTEDSDRPDADAAPDPEFSVHATATEEDAPTEETAASSTPTAKPTTTSPVASSSVSTTSDGAAATTTANETGDPGNISGGGGDPAATNTQATTTATSTHATTTATTSRQTDSPPIQIPETERATQTTATSTADNKPAGDDNATDTDETETARSTTTSDTASTPSRSVTEPIQLLTNNGNRYQFGETECVSVGDGAFYCSEDTDGSPQQENGVYAQVAEGGDREIFINADGLVTRITDNAYEDAAPYLDAAAEQVVFHRLIDGRYQILRYDLDSGKEEQLTDSRENNMEPAQADGITVWQRWSGDNWEIALYDGAEISRLTNNSHHDVAPTVRDGYVMWHTTNADGEKLLSIHEIETGITSTIADPDGGHVENPRFVLVYDTKYENGDTVTKEYDPETGAITPVGTEPVPIPTKIPEPDPSGETRALSGVKTTSRDDTNEVLETGTGTSTPKAGTTSAPATSTATSTDANAIADVDMAASSSEPMSLSEYDLIVEPRTTSTENTTSTTGVTATSGPEV